MILGNGKQASLHYPYCYSLSFWRVKSLRVEPHKVYLHYRQGIYINPRGTDLNFKWLITLCMSLWNSPSFVGALNRINARSRTFWWGLQLALKIPSAFPIPRRRVTSFSVRAYRKAERSRVSARKSTTINKWKNWFANSRDSSEHHGMPRQEMITALVNGDTVV